MPVIKTQSDFKIMLNYCKRLILIKQKLWETHKIHEMFEGAWHSM